jgi:hypothetical protein
LIGYHFPAPRQACQNRRFGATLRQKHEAMTFVGLGSAPICSIHHMSLHEGLLRINTRSGVVISGNFNLRNLAVFACGQIRHHVPLNGQFLPIMLRPVVGRFSGALLAEKSLQTELLGSVRVRRAGCNFVMKRHVVMSFARKETNPPP